MSEWTGYLDKRGCPIFTGDTIRTGHGDVTALIGKHFGKNGSEDYALVGEEPGEPACRFSDNPGMEEELLIVKSFIEEEE